MPVNRALLSRTGPSFNLNFLTGTLDSRLTFTRASAAWYFDATGTLQSASTNIPRFDYGVSPGGVTNWIRNNSMVGVAAGTPGTVPTNWIISVNAGLTRTIVGSGTSNGIPYIDVQLSGTTNSSTASLIAEDGGSVFGASSGQTFTYSSYLAIVGGSTANITSIAHRNRENDSGGTIIQNNSTADFKGTLTASLARITHTTTLSGAGTYFIAPALAIAPTGSGVAIDITLRIGGPQIEQAASAGTLVLTTNGAANLGAIPLGLQFEESRTNSIRNNSNTGTVVGTPGTLPTNWTVSGLGATTSVIAFGTENGIPYCDVQFNGTTTSAGQIAIGFESPAATAVAAQLWTGSAFLRLISGAFTNVTALGLQVNVTGGTGSVRTSATPTSASLASQRITTVVTAGTGTTGVNLFFVGTVASGVAINFTIRCGAPCLELGSFVTSPILTTTVAITRAVDNASMPVGSWFNPSGHSVLCVGMVPAINGVSNMIVYEFDDGVSTRVMVYVGASAIALFNSVGAVNISIVSGAVVAGSLFKMSGGFSNSRQAGSGNGSTVVSSSGSTLPIGISTLRFGSNQGIATNQRYTGYVQSLTVWPRVLSDSELQKTSTR